MSIKRIALSGGPGTGKTSLIHELERRGFPCSHEYSRHIIQQSLDTGSNVLPWDDLDTFSEVVMEGRIEQHKAAEGAIHFFDRTIIDTIAYQEADNLVVREEWIRAAEKYRYFETVFITPPWKEIYHADEQRRESFEKLERLHEFVVKTYSEYGYNVVEIPKFNVEERANWLLKTIE
ncbi:MAG: ATP-binding protein [Flavobacteriia bacterium]|nr:ATP-binding protein [Flavobacteriia bacterium]